MQSIAVAMARRKKRVACNNQIVPLELPAAYKIIVGGGGMEGNKQLESLLDYQSRRLGFSRSS